MANDYLPVACILKNEDAFSKQLIVKINTATMYKSITLLHGEHNEWISKLSFYNDELVVMRKWLDDVVKRNNSEEFLISLEHF